MTTTHEALTSMHEFLRRARHAGAGLAHDPDGQAILGLVMQAEQQVDGWLKNAGALIESLDHGAVSRPSVDDVDVALVLEGLRSVTASADSIRWATADHVAERIGRPLGFVLDALGAAAAAGWVESVYHYTLSYQGERWMLDKGDFLLEDQ